MKPRLSRRAFLIAAILAIPLSFAAFSTARALSYASQLLDTYYRVQDDILFPTEIGRRYIELFYGLSSEVWQISLTHDEVMSQATRLLLGFEPQLHELVEGRGAGVLVTREMVSDVESFLDLVAQYGSPELRSAIQSERARLPLGDLVGLSFQEAQLRILGPPEANPPGAPPTHVPMPALE
jgi:hypothetical protein